MAHTAIFNPRIYDLKDETQVTILSPEKYTYSAGNTRTYLEQILTESNCLLHILVPPALYAQGLRMISSPYFHTHAIVWNLKICNTSDKPIEVQKNQAIALITRIKY